MSGKEQARKNGEQGGVLDSVKEAGKGINNEVFKKTGGSQVKSVGQQLAQVQQLAFNTIPFQVGDVVQEQESGRAKKVAKE